MALARGAARESVNTAATVSPTESGIAALAYQLWLDNGPRCDTRRESAMVVEFRWEGHWEAWEREWGGARWIWD